MPTLSNAEIKAKIAARPFWYHQIEVAPGIVTPGVQPSPLVLQSLHLPEDMTGMRALDIGAADGFYSFECARRRAAEVVAIDYLPPEAYGFALVKELLGAEKITHCIDNIYNLSPAKYGHFDVVLFTGMIYHLPDPMLCLQIVRSLCKPSAVMAVETHVIDQWLLPQAPEAMRQQLMAEPLMQFYLDNAFHNDWTNFWGPNVTCMKQMLVQSGFEVLHTDMVLPGRATFSCRKVEDPRREHDLRLAYGSFLDRLQGLA